MSEKKPLTQRENEVIALGLSCLENKGINYDMLAERGGYKTHQSARESFRQIKNKFIALVGVDPVTGVIDAPKETDSKAASTSATVTPARAVPTRAAAVRGASARAASAKVYPFSRVRPTRRASSTRRVPAKRRRRAAAASPSTSEEDDYNSNETDDIDDTVEGDGEEDYKPPRVRAPRPPTKKAKTSVETKEPNDDSDEAAPKEQSDERDDHDDDKAVTLEKPKKEELGAVVPTLNAEPKEQDSMIDSNAGEDEHAPDANPTDSGDVAMTDGVDVEEEIAVRAEQDVGSSDAAPAFDYDSEMQGATAEPQSGEAADYGVLDDMAGILMQAAAMEAQMRADDEL